MTSPEHIVETIKAEIQKSLDSITATTEKALRDLCNQAGTEINRLKELAKNQAEEVHKNVPKKDAKQEMTNAIKQYQEQISKVECETIKSLNDSWTETKAQASAMIEKVKPALGDYAKIAQDTLKDIQKVVDKEIAECSKRTKETSKQAKQEMQKTVDQLAKQK